jgi:pilus assembly protein CpaF
VTDATALDQAQAAWARIMPFLRPIEALISDPEISDIMVNGHHAVFFEKYGRKEQLRGVMISEKALQVAAKNIARALDADIDDTNPILDSRLPDGSRVAIVLAPVSVTGTSVSIRKFQNKRFDAQELVRVGMIPAEVLKELQDAVVNRKSVLISGPTGSGKTTLLNALAASIPDEERVIIIEDTSEIQIDKPDLVRLEARREQANFPAVTIRALLRASLRMRPDRILLGEVRGEEAFDLMQALNTGHQGTLSTTHANSAALSLTRFATCVMMAGIELPHQTVQRNIADALQFVVHIERRHGKRSVSEVLRIKGYDVSEDTYKLETIYQRPVITGRELIHDQRSGDQVPTNLGSDGRG